MKARSETSIGYEAFSVLPGIQGQLCPDLLTEEEAICFLRIVVTRKVFIIQRIRICQNFHSYQANLVRLGCVVKKEYKA